MSSTYIIYHDALSSGWVDWSWNTDRNLSNHSPVQAGSSSVAAKYTSAWAGFYLHNSSGPNADIYSHLSFWIHGGSSGNQNIRVIANGNGGAAVTITAPANQWAQVLIPLTALGSPAVLVDLYWQESTGASQPEFYLDEIALTGSGITPPAPPDGNGIALQVDANQGLHPISPEIYGMNFASETLAAELRLTVNRYGGNATTRYNWQNDTSNRASDWYFENIPNENNNPSALPHGSSSDNFIDQNRRTGAQSLMTIPMIGWTPKSREKTCGFAVSVYGAQQGTDGWMPDCGNGIRVDGSFITNNNPLDTSLAIGLDFVKAWIAHLISRYATAGNGGVRFYNLDNEPMLWSHTHRDVHPLPVSYDEMRDRTYQYAAAIKDADSSALTLGPVVWGWTAYFYSAKDSSQGGAWWENPVDRNAHGGMPFVEWYLQQMKAYETTNGRRILDYLDLHYYPQASNIALDSEGDANRQALRLRSTRSLWDPAYTDESWINEPVRLIPRMREWVNTYYPGTRLAITEYNWGAHNHINGALAQADVLGIFGREGLDLATLWAPPGVDEPGAFAFRMYRNYDGQGSAFGDTSIQAVSADQGQLAIYAARRSSDNALTLMVINKTSAAQPSTLSLVNFTPTGSAQVFRYSTANLSAIQHLADLALSENSLNTSFPANSITLLVLK